MSRKPPKGKSLAEVNPELAKQWHPTKNGEMTPENIYAGLNKKVWWKCNKGDDHEWFTSPNSRSKGRECPVCTGKKIVKSNCLGTLNPELAKEWHPTKNIEFTPAEASANGSQRVWWKCPKGDDHEWEARIAHRNNGIGCPFCSNRRLSSTNNLTVTAPELLEEWDYEKNLPLTPEKIIAAGDKKYWWICKTMVEDHVWEASVYNRLKGTGCPMCRGLKVVYSNSLAKTHPELIKEWHPTKNPNVTPDDITSGSRKTVWWKCPAAEDHEWEASVYNRALGTGCPVCTGNKTVASNSLKVLSPELAKEWHPTKNKNITPKNVLGGGHKKYWWKCPKGDDHEWEASVSYRLRKPTCPICNNSKIVLSNSLLILNPNLAKEWHPSKNKKSPASYGMGSHANVWWKCPKGEDHEWKAQIVDRNNGNGCPICRGFLVVESNALSTTHPQLAKEWHPTKNGNLMPSNYIAGSGKSVWWKCPKGEDHEWKAQIVSRKNGTGCPCCSGQKLVPSTSLAELFPLIAAQWHPIKNAPLTPNKVLSGGHLKVWWQCDKDKHHEWLSSIVNRTRGRNCPYCTLTPQSRQELIITFELCKFFNDINPKGLKTRVDGKLHSIDIYIPSLNLGVEFDGSYWHKGKRELDKVKTLKFEAAGFNIVRVREEPLKRIFETDIISKQPYNGKEITDNLLKQIMTSYKLDKRTITKIEKYMLKDELQNQKALDKYIDQILTEKAEKKIKKP